ncbi:MAG: response regulator [Verrucomicrobia bacterium]|nr:response regulator [Verrucomicrobiota bacterium]
MNPESDDVILLVEDNSNDVMLLQRAFTKVGLATALHVASDGEEAVAYLSGTGAFADRAQHPLPTVMFLDLKLPKKSGHEVLEWLRAQPALRRLPVVVLSTSQQPADINLAYDLGANSYVVKPVHFDDLVDIVRALDIYWFRFNQGPVSGYAPME